MSTPASIRSHRAVREAIKAFREQAILERPDCWLCGQEIAYEISDPYDDAAFEVDHLYPISKYPELAADPSGFRAAHRGCNRERGSSETVVQLGFTSQDWESLGDG